MIISLFVSVFYLTFSVSLIRVHAPGLFFLYDADMSTSSSDIADFASPSMINPLHRQGRQVSATSGPKNLLNTACKKAEFQASSARAMTSTDDAKSIIKPHPVLNVSRAQI